MHPFPHGHRIRPGLPFRRPANVRVRAQARGRGLHDRPVHEHLRDGRTAQAVAGAGAQEMAGQGCASAGNCAFRTHVMMSRKLAVQ